MKQQFFCCFSYIPLDGYATLGFSADALDMAINPVGG